MTNRKMTICKVVECQKTIAKLLYAKWLNFYMPDDKLQKHNPFYYKSDKMSQDKMTIG